MWTGLQVLVLLAGLCMSAHAASFIQPEWGYYYDQDDQGPNTYTYGYDIEDAASRNIQFRRERRLPNGTVTGSYGLVEPDGNVRVVHYTADSLGYRTTIENSQRPNENHPAASARWGEWQGRRPWDSWYRDPLWNPPQSAALSHALEALRTPPGPVHEQRTPPALQDDYLADPEADQSQSYPVYDLPPGQPQPATL